MEPLEGDGGWFMTKPMQAGDPQARRPNPLPDQKTADDPVEQASEESFPASDPPVWNASQEAAPAPSSTTQEDKSKQGCAVSFLNEERGEMDKLCERRPAEQPEEYTQPEEEREVGGEG
jgi:hypothetical protein